MALFLWESNSSLLKRCRCFHFFEVNLMVCSASSSVVWGVFINSLKVFKAIFIKRLTVSIDTVAVV